MENPMLGQIKVLPILEEIKRNARIIKKTHGVPHFEALNRAAVLIKFENYRHARKSVTTGDSTTKPLAPATQFIIRISQFWADGEQRGKETLEVALSRPLLQITKPQRLRLIRGLARSREISDGVYESEYVTHGQVHAQGVLYSAKIPGEDHVKIWFDPKTLRYVICDEPYQREFNNELSQRQAWLETFGYAMATPEWLGTYNPYMDESNGSRLHLVSHATKGVDVKLLASALNTLPAPVGHGRWSGVSGPSYW
jgi:hypothetical protein